MDSLSPVTFTPIGRFTTPHTEPAGMPIQPSGAVGVRGEIRLLPELEPGLSDLDGFSHIIALYHFHRSEGFELTVTPYLDTEERGVFSTRAPRRPNPIGLSVLRLISVTGNVLTVEDVDVLDGTPVLDIKPYAPDFDSRKAERIGWMEGKSADAVQTRSDDRFAKDE